jgi:hypothetical protein
MDDTAFSKEDDRRPCSTNSWLFNNRQCRLKAHHDTVCHDFKAENEILAGWPRSDGFVGGPEGRIRFGMPKSEPINIEPRKHRGPGEKAQKRMLCVVYSEFQPAIRCQV